MKLIRFHAFQLLTFSFVSSCPLVRFGLPQLTGPAAKQARPHPWHAMRCDCELNVASSMASARRRHARGLRTHANVPCRSQVHRVTRRPYADFPRELSCNLQPATAAPAANARARRGRAGDPGSGRRSGNKTPHDTPRCTT
jgi:hypothetical protein